MGFGDIEHATVWIGQPVCSRAAITDAGSGAPKLPVDGSILAVSSLGPTRYSSKNATIVSRCSKWVPVQMAFQMG